MLRSTWSELKSLIDSKGMNVDYLEFTDHYYIVATDGPFNVYTKLKKTDPASSDQTEFETTYKPSANTTIIPKDSTGAPLNRIKVTEAGWSFQLHGIEFETSKLGSVVSDRYDGTPFGFSTIKFYDDQAQELTQQVDISLSCVKTVIDWEPTHDYEIVGGSFKLESLIAQDVRMWVVGVPDVPEAYGGSKEFVANVNFRYIGTEEGIKADGRASKLLTYDAQNHTSKMRIIITHPAGYQHKFHCIFEIFKP